MELLKEERRRIQSELLLIIIEVGGKVTVDGFGSLEVSTARLVVSYDRKKVETIILKLIDLSHYHLADALKACKQESVRAGVLPILHNGRWKARRA